MGWPWVPAILFAMLLAVPNRLAADDAPMPAQTLDVAMSLAGLTPKEFTELVERTKESVAVVSFGGRDRQELGLGAGFIVREDGLIATNLHVIGEARPINVRLHDGRTFPVVEVYATEKSQDLAIIRIEADGLTPLSLAPPDELKQGQPVFALGNPQGLEYSVVTGVVSGFRDGDDGLSLIQLAIPIERGNSGGPLLDMHGHVHGLLTLKSQVTENLGYAVKASYLQPLLDDPNPVPMARWLTIGRLNKRYWQYSDAVHWAQRAGQIRVEGVGPGFGGRALCLWKETPPEVPFEVEVSVKMDQEDGAAGLVFHSDGADRHYGFYPSSGKLRFTRFDGPTVYQWHVLAEERSPYLQDEDWNRLKVRIEADRYLCYCNDELVFDISDSEYTSGLVGLAKFRHTTADFKQFQIATRIPSHKVSEDLLARIEKQTRQLPLDEPPSVHSAAGLGDVDGQELLALNEYADRLELKAARLRELAEAVRQENLRNELIASLNVEEGETINLARAALLLAAIDNQDVDVALSLRQIDDLAQDFLKDLPSDSSPEDKLQKFHSFLFEQQGFHGSRTNYYHASNSYLNEVIDDREGLPITLSVLYIELARRVGIEAEGVGLPGHFIVRVRWGEGDSAEEKLVDVFNRGEFLSKSDCRRRVREIQGLAWDDEYLAAQSPRQILLRMLRNLIGIANDDQDAQAALRYTNTVLALDPDSAQDHLFKAVVCYSSRRVSEGLTEVEWLLDRQPEGIDLRKLEQLKEAFEQLQLPTNNSDEPAR